MTKQFVLQSCFFYLLPRHTNVMTDNGFNIFYECAARCVHLPPQKEGAPLLEGTLKCTHLAAYQIYRGY